MAQQSYSSWKHLEIAVAAFEGLIPHVEMLRALQMECGDDLPDRNAFGIALDGLDTAAFCFTKRPHFYHQLDSKYPWPRTPSNGRLKELSEAIATFDALEPYRQALMRSSGQCQPFGRHYLAIQIPLHGLVTACYHFTRMPDFYSCGDAAGPARRRS